jgi:ribosomal protein S18 acetylase RimI-like enzyme
MITSTILNLDYEIRKLRLKDFTAWRELRLEAVTLHPETFSSTYEEEKKLSIDDFKSILTNSQIFGIFCDNGLVGIAGVTKLQLKKFGHRGNLFGMYLKKEYRGCGMADALIETLKKHASRTLVQLTCGVIIKRDNAVRFYQRHGFRILGMIPRSLKLNETYYDEYIMGLELQGY